MGGNYNRQRKSSSSSFMSIFNIFRSSSSSKDDSYYDGNSSDEVISMGIRVYKSDEDDGQWGAADPRIDMKADAFIRQYKMKVTESQVHYQTAQVE